MQPSTLTHGRYGPLLRTLLFVTGLLLTGGASISAMAHDGHDTGNLPGDATRIISVGGALTEIIYALGEQDRLIANDTTSYFPEAAARLPKVGYQRALSAEGMLSLQPDLVVASADAGPAAVISQIRSAGVPWQTLTTATGMDGVIENIRELGHLLNAQERAAALIADLQAQRQRLASQISAQPSGKRILFILQHTGGAPMVAGTTTAADRIIGLAGGVNAFASMQGYKPMTPEAVVMAKPDLILTTNMGMEQAGGADALLQLPGLALTPAGQARRVIAMDSLLLLGFGPRTVEAADQLYHLSLN